MWWLAPQRRWRARVGSEASSDTSFKTGCASIRHAGPSSCRFSFYSGLSCLNRTHALKVVRHVFIDPRPP
jgi:hypothetical protein